MVLSLTYVTGPSSKMLRFREQDKTNQVDIGSVDKLMDDMAELQDESGTKRLRRPDTNDHTTMVVVVCSKT